MGGRDEAEGMGLFAHLSYLLLSHLCVLCTILETAVVEIVKIYNYDCDYGCDCFAFLHSVGVCFLGCLLFSAFYTHHDFSFLLQHLPISVVIFTKAILL